MRKIIVFAILLLLLTMHLIAITYVTAELSSYELISAIGSLSSGAGTIFLAFLAYKTFGDWRNQVSYQHCLDLLAKYDDQLMVIYSSTWELIHTAEKKKVSFSEKHSEAHMRLLAQSEHLIGYSLQLMSLKKSRETHALVDYSTQMRAFMNHVTTLCERLENEQEPDTELIKHEFKNAFSNCLDGSSDCRDKLIK